MNKKLMLLSAALLIGTGTAMAQKAVTGRVIDEDGQPVVSANVRVTGTQIATFTDENGNFTLKNVPANAKTLSVTYIGMETTTISIAGAANIVMKLLDNALEEAVVVGYGTGQKLGTVVGAVKKIGAGTINGKPSISVADAMQGQVAGLQVLMNTGDMAELRNSTSITLRGAGSLYAGNEPLIVVDGSPADGTVLSLLNNNDIESVTVLKDASATSIYGSRASNGVIYITTKKGRREEKTQIVLSQRFGWSQLAQNIGDPMNSLELLNFQLENGIITPVDYVERKNYFNNVLKGKDFDWQEFFFSNAAPMYQTDLSIRGGSTNSAYFVSASHLDQKGLTYKNFMQRSTVRTNLEAKANDWLSFGINQSASYTDRRADNFSGNAVNNSLAPSNGAYYNAPYWNPYDADMLKTRPGYVKYMNFYNPKWVIDRTYNTVNDIVYNGQAFLTLTPLRGLTIKSQIGLYATDLKQEHGYSVDFPDPEVVGTKGAAHGRSSQWTNTNTVEYKFSIGDEHDFTLLGGHEGIKYHSDRFGVSIYGLTDSRFFTLNDVVDKDHINFPSEAATNYQYLSFFGRVDYMLRGKYAFNFTLRNDRSSRFGPKNRSAIFMSGGVSWRAKMEDFLRQVEWLDNLTVRLTAGSTGNSSVGNYEYLGLIGNDHYNGNMAWKYIQVPNPELGWEKQIQFNLGFNATLWKWINLDLNLYNRKTKDMLMNTPVPYTTGYVSQLRNIGAMTNRGVEIEASFDIIKRRDAYLTFRTTFGYNFNRIDELFFGYKEWPMMENLVSYISGKSLNFYMPIYAGVDKNDGAPMWYKKGHKGDPVHDFDPATMTKDKTKLDEIYQDTGKKYHAPINGGFNITAGWKGFTLGMDFAYTLGKWMVDNARYFATTRQNAMRGSNMRREMLNMWKQPGDLTDIPAFHYDVHFDTHLLDNASFLRLKNLTLAYDLPSSWIQRTGFISSVRLIGQARNLFTISTFTGVDPEVASNITYGNYPATRQYTIGVDITF